MDNENESVKISLAANHSFNPGGTTDGSKCNLFEEQDIKSLRRQSALYHVIFLVINIGYNF